MNQGTATGRIWVNGPAPQQQIQMHLSCGGPRRRWCVELQQDERGENLYFGSLALFIGYLAQLEMAPGDSGGTGAVYGLR